jgi:hypothetical protein
MDGIERIRTGGIRASELAAAFERLNSAALSASMLDASALKPPDRSGMSYALAVEQQRLYEDKIRAFRERLKRSLGL